MSLKFNIYYIRDSSEFLDEEGSFELDDKAVKIMKISIINPVEKDLNCLVEWKPREITLKMPKPTWINMKLLRVLDPQVVIDFMMNHVKFPSIPPQKLNKF